MGRVLRCKSCVFMFPVCALVSGLVLDWGKSMTKYRQGAEKWCSKTDRQLEKTAKKLD
jgi:hypothetical protein